MSQENLALSVEQLEYIYCGEKIADAAGHLSINEQLLMLVDNQAFIADFHQGLGHFFKQWRGDFTYASDCYSAARIPCTYDRPIDI